MDTLNTSTKMNVKQCSLCQRGTEYYCHSCQKDLCKHCKAMHVIDLDTKDHEVTIYREKFKYIPIREFCVTHSDRIYTKYCEPCEIPVCGSCSEHTSQLSPISDSRNDMHRLLDIRTIYQTKRQQHNEIIHNVRSETLYNSRVLLKKLKSDVNIKIKTFHLEIIRGHFMMLSRGLRLNDLIKSVMLDEINKHRCLKQINTITQYITGIQNFEHRYEQLAFRPVQFLRFIKNIRLPLIQDTPHLKKHCLLSLIQDKSNIEDLIGILSEIKITKGGRCKLQAGNELLLTLLPSPVLKKSTTVEGVSNCAHIALVSPTRFWVSDGEGQIILADITTGEKLHIVDDSSDSLFGSHTVNSECELIYIDNDDNTKKLSKDRKTTTTFIRKPHTLWIPKCVYCCLTTGDLLIGMQHTHGLGEVRRYNNTGEHTQTIQHKISPLLLDWNPIFITENNNGDVVVSNDNDLSTVVVADRGGKLCFLLSDPPSGIPVAPLGICTDGLSNILVCDENTSTVQMINKDGEFQSYLLTQEYRGIYGQPHSLSYDVKTHLLWVTSWEDNKVSVYRYINRHLDNTDDTYL